MPRRGSRPSVVRVRVMRIAAVFCAALLVALAVGASRASSRAAAGRVGLGVLGSPSRFRAETGQTSSTRLLIAAWGATNFAQLFSMMGERPMLGLGASAISPGAIARGEADGYLAALNAAIADYGRPLYVRPLAEMNGHWNAYSAYEANGASRGTDHSTAMFRKAFARIYLAVHGGGGVASALRRLGLPPFHGTLAENPFAEVIWNPQGYGSPDLRGNSAQAYYPGDRFVDVVGDDLYDIRGKAEWAAADALYAAHPSKPFAFPEWGLWGLDDPSFVRAMADFVRSHRRTVLISYYSGRPGSVFDLASKPASRAAYRTLIVPLGH
jgi:hypothetical protein